MTVYFKFLSFPKHRIFLGFDYYILLPDVDDALSVSLDGAVLAEVVGHAGARERRLGDGGGAAELVVVAAGGARRRRLRRREDCADQLVQVLALGRLLRARRPHQRQRQQPPQLHASGTKYAQFQIVCQF